MLESSIYLRGEGVRTRLAPSTERGRGGGGRGERRGGEGSVIMIRV